MTTAGHTQSRVRARGVFHLVLAMLRRRRLQRVTTRALRDLDDHLLRDVGLVRGRFEPRPGDRGGW